MDFIKKITTICLMCFYLQAYAMENFVIQDIRTEGLQRISAGTIFNYLPLKIGDEVTEQSLIQSLKALFKTGFFDDVQLEREDDTLIVFVKERSAISSIEFDGNSDIETEQLEEALKQIGFAEGRTYNRSVLDKVIQELEQQYFSRGKYGVKIKNTITPLERNRVAIKVTIVEGDVAKIHRINIVGNHAFSEEELLEEFELSTPTLFSFYTKNDQYSKIKLTGDVEKLRAFYLDRGYINFSIDSTQVSITPDKKNIYITLNITEGEQYTTGEVRLAGDLVVDAKELFPLVKINSEDIFSRKRITVTSDYIIKRLENEGYAFANVNPIPEVDEENKTVALTFFIDPGRRVYVRRINIQGNTKTSDKVIRREIRQMESGWIATQKVERSRTRLNKLGFFKDVNVETPAVLNTNDQVDINFSVEEQSTGSFNAGVGFSQSQGFLVNFSLTQDNFLGTGNRYSMAFNNSRVNTIYSFSFSDPYYTLDGISRAFNFSYRETDANQNNLSNYNLDVITGGVIFGIPINEYDRIRTGLRFERTKINIQNEEDVSQHILDFIEAQGDQYNVLLTTIGWSHDSRNRAIFPNRGGYQSLSAEIAIPGLDLEYYKLRYRQQRFFPLSKKLTLLLNGNVGYADSYSQTNDVPPFEYFFVGGIGSVRGFDDNTLGPRDKKTNDPIGGTVKLVMNAEVIFPMPFVKDSRSVRLSGFVDAGNVYKEWNAVDLGEIRYSSGVAMAWLSPFGLLKFSLGTPLNEQDGDDKQVFQFTFGSSF